MRLTQTLFRSESMNGDEKLFSRPRVRLSGEITKSQVRNRSLVVIL